VLYRPATGPMTGSTATGHRTISNIPSLVCALLASLSTGGNTYAFGLYGGALKARLQLSQGDLDTISTCFFLAGLGGWMTGLVVDRCGERLALALSGLCSAVSLGTYWAYVVTQPTQQDDQPTCLFFSPVWVLSLISVAVFLSNSLAVGAVFKLLSSRSDPSHKGSVVGLAKAYVGLGAGTYTCLFQAFESLVAKDGREDSSLDFLLLAAILALLLATVPALVLLPKTVVSTTTASAQNNDQASNLYLLPIKQTTTTDDLVDEFVDDTTNLHYWILYLSLGSMMVILVGSVIMELQESTVLPIEDNATAALVDLIQSDKKMSSYSRLWTVTILLVCWIIPILSWLCLPRQSLCRVTHESQAESAIVIPTENSHLLMPFNYSETHESQAESAKVIPTENSPLLSPSYSETNEIPPASASLKQPGETGYQYNLLEMLQTQSAYFLLWTTTILVGAGTTVVNNLAQIVESQSYASKLTPASLAIFSVAQALSRAVTGTVSDAAQQWTVPCHMNNIQGGIPRSFFLVIASAITCVAHVILYAAVSKWIFLAGIFTAGIAFGMVWPLMVLVVGDFFGAKHLGACYMFFDGFTVGMGTLLLSKGVAQRVYDENTSVYSLHPLTCMGKRCFAGTHAIIAVLSLTCVISSFAGTYANIAVLSLTCFVSSIAFTI